MPESQPHLEWPPILWAAPFGGATPSSFVWSMGEKFWLQQTFSPASEIPQKLVSEVNKSICHNQFRCKILSLQGVARKFSFLV